MWASVFWLVQCFFCALRRYCRSAAAPRPWPTPITVHHRAGFSIDLRTTLTLGDSTEHNHCGFSKVPKQRGLWESWGPFCAACWLSSVHRTTNTKIRQFQVVQSPLVSYLSVRQETVFAKWKHIRSIPECWMVSFACSQKGHEAFSAFPGHFICGFSQFHWCIYFRIGVIVFHNHVK